VNTYKDGQRQDNQWDIVHDLPQLFEAMRDELDLSIEIQHSGAIRLPVGDQVQAYRNQAAMLQDLSARAIEQEATIRRLLIMMAEVTNTNRELMAGLGMPVTTKHLQIEVGGKVELIEYPAYQQSKPSAGERISGLEKNLGIIMGMLLPHKNIIKNLNPWAKK
jgi:hypothetical protein